MKQHLIETLTRLGGKATNKKLLELLMSAEGAWDRTTYLQLRAELIAEGVIKLGRGRGGTVKLS